MRILTAISVFLLFTSIIHSKKVFGLEIGNKENGVTTQTFSVTEDSSGVDELLKLFAQNYNSDTKIAHAYATLARDISSKINYTKGLAYSNYYLAVIFVGYDFELSETMLMEALQAAEMINDQLLLGKIYNIAGHLKNNLKEYNPALEFFDQSLELFYKSNNDSMAAAVYNNIAISYKALGNYDLAIENYFKAVDINTSSGNYNWLATNYYNIAYDYLQNADTVNGLNYLHKSIEIVDKKKIIRLRPYIFVAYSDHYLDNKNFKQALTYANKALTASHEQMNRLQERIVLKLISQIYYEMGNIDSAFFYQKSLIAINDSINQDAQTRELDFLEMKHTFQKELAQHQLKIKLMETEELRSKTATTVFILIIIIIILILIFVLIILKNRIKQKTLELKSSKLENEKLSLEIKHKKQELATNVMYLLNRNEFIDSLAKKIERLPLDDNKNNLEVCNEIVSDINKKNSEKIWEEFDLRFREAHEGFYSRLNNKFPQLSPSDLRVAAFMKLNMSTKEISLITLQSPATLRTARHRLRKKLGLDRNENLIAFLNNI